MTFNSFIVSESAEKGIKSAIPVIVKMYPI